jgi:TorA maturation chaperone TorD
VQQIPELTAVLPTPFNTDDAAASHHALFQFNVFAFESFFLSVDGLVGGEQTAIVNQRYANLGFRSLLPANQADHLGQELACLAFLVEQEADACEADLPTLAKRVRAKQGHFLQENLLRWAPACLLAIQNQTNPFFAQLAELTLDLLLAHFAAVATPPLGESAVSIATDLLPPVQNILANDKTGFKEIANFLLLPAFSGIYLSRDHIGQLGRQFDLPRGFGSREMMLLNLLRTAVQYDALAPLLTALQDTCRKWQTSYQDLINSYPHASLFIQPWLARAATTEQIAVELMVSSIAE